MRRALDIRTPREPWQSLIRTRRRLAEEFEPDEDLELDENLEPNEDKSVPQTDFEEKRREHVFGDNSKLKPAHIEDIQGMPHIVEDIKKFITFLKDYRKFKEKNVRVQPGILLCGDPGTGKTLTARVIATESGAKLIDAGGFPRRGRGWTAGDIGSLFAMAKEYHAQTERPVIIYFDEFDEVCPDERRYRSEASPALMTELDGIGGKPEGIFVIASANSRDVDEGLLRAGRLGYHLRYHPPAYSGRLEVLKFYLDKKPHGPVDAESLAEVMPYMSPAEIEELVEQAYMNACFASSTPKLTESDLINQLLEEVMGSRSGTWLTDDEHYRACVHEAGHIIVGEQLGCPAKLVVVPKKMYERGVTLFGSLEEDPPTLWMIESRLAASYGGEVAEELVFGEHRLGCTNDVGKATELSIRLVANWGEKVNYCDVVHEDPNLVHNNLIVPLDEDERSSIYSEARRIRERCYQRAKEVLEKFGKESIEHVARQIAEREFLLKRDVGPVVGEARTLNNETVECRAKTDGGEVDFSLDQSADFAKKR